MSALVFKLSMPGRNSWNGRWSGEETLYAIIKPIRKTKKARAKADEILNTRYFSHNFGDGWRASLEVSEADGPELRRIKKHSKGFCGYDWMVVNILSHGKASDLTDEEKAAACVKAFEPLNQLTTV